MASPDLNIGTSGAISAASTSRALVRVTPVFPQPATTADGSPLDRSGLDVRELITTADHMVMRSRTPAIALDMGLEHARGSMVRNNPAEALAILDEVWSGARHTETGWYVRASSLALLGLTGEAARVATDALIRNPDSSANHFLLSLAKLSLGELQAARASLADASRNRQPDALLLVQTALLEAQSGNVDAAEQLFRRAAAASPDHPALWYGRRMIREVLQCTARERPFASGVERDVLARWRTPVAARTPVSVNSIPGDKTMNGSVAQADPLADAMQHLGRSLRTGTTHDIASTARGLLASLSAGGAFANATSPARALVMRTVLSAIVAALNASGKTSSVGWASESHDGQWQRADFRGVDVGGAEPRMGSTAASNQASFAAGIDAHEVLTETVRAIVSAMRGGRAGDAPQYLQRAQGLLDPISMAVLRALVVPADASSSDDSGERQGKTSPRAADDTDNRVRTQDTEPALLAPIRLGLALLPEVEMYSHAHRPNGVDESAISHAAMQSAAYFSSESKGGTSPAGGLGALVAAAALFALAVLAFAFRQTVLGVALLAAGGWMVLRRHAPTEQH